MPCLCKTCLDFKAGTLGQDNERIFSIIGDFRAVKEQDTRNALATRAAIIDFGLLFSTAGDKIVEN